MTFQVVPFEPEHILQLDVQEAQRLTDDEQARALAAPFGWAWTGMVDGVPVACAGLVEVWQGRAYAWALLARTAGPWMAAITRAVRRALKASTFDRIEMAVDAGFVAGQRWALLLGFELETPRPLRRYLPGGRDAYLYAMVT
jgi:hypothetical protein